MNNFIFFSSYYEAVKELSAEKQGQVYKAIIDYAMEGIEPNLKGIQRSIFTLIKPYIDSSKKKQISGSMGGKANSKSTSKQVSKDISKTTSTVVSEISSKPQSETISNKLLEEEKEKEYLKKEINKEKVAEPLTSSFEDNSINRTELKHRSLNTLSDSRQALGLLTDSELLTLIENEFSDSEVCQKFKDYALMRKAMGKNKAIRTKSTFDSCVKKLRKYAKTREEALEILDYSIANCYQGLFDRFGHGMKSVDKEAIPYAN